ncbi:MAG: cytochrome c3 family protein [Acidobacteriota bacterium]
MKFPKINNYKKYLPFFLIITGIIIIFLGFFSYRITRKSSFCVSCHYMEPYVKRWKSSLHKNIECLKCHSITPIKQGVFAIKYLTGIYDPRPKTYVPDSRCLSRDCHDFSSIEKPLEFKKGIKFSHKNHYGQIKRDLHLSCSSCHYEMEEEIHIFVNDKNCYLCHFLGAPLGEAISGCPSCHGIPKKKIIHEGYLFDHFTYRGIQCKQCHLNVASGNGKISEEKCYSCHIEKKRDEKASRSIHQIHSEKKSVKCLECHDEIQHSNIAMIRTLDVRCEICHKNLHSPQKGMYIGIGASGVQPLPSIMFKALVSCEGCHIFEEHKEKEEIYKASRKSCVQCHGKQYDVMLDNWISYFNELDQSISEILNKTGEIEKTKRNHKNFNEVKKIIENIKLNRDFILNGKGVHNPHYAIRIVKTMTEQFNLIQQIFDQPQIEFTSVNNMIENSCISLCHRIIPLKSELKFEDYEFPHLKHANQLKITCIKCHSLEFHKRTTINKNDCNLCHHSKENKQCTGCHSLQLNMYKGSGVGIGITKQIQNLMPDLSCVDCHDMSIKKHSLKTLLAKCIECHGEKSYEEILMDWNNSHRKYMDELNQKLKEIEIIFDRMKKEKNIIPENLIKLYKECEFNYNKIKEAGGLHNVEYSENILKYSINISNIILEQLRKYTL